jgi:hypothetical protein
MPPKYIPEWRQLRNLTSWFLFLTDLVFKWATSQHIWWKGFGARFFPPLFEVLFNLFHGRWYMYYEGNRNPRNQIKNYDLIYDKSRNNFNYLLFYFSPLI